MQANILVDDDGRARLTDFGLITVSESQVLQTTTMSGEGGSLRWMAPESMIPSRDGRPTSRSSDIYAFGMTIIEVTASPLIIR
jgi:serine/threonine protein kinase